MTDMKSLHQIIIEKGADYDFERIDDSHLVGVAHGTPVVVRAILNRTAICHPLNNDAPAHRKVINLHETFVWPQDIRWEKRGVPRIAEW